MTCCATSTPTKNHTWQTWLHMKSEKSLKKQKTKKTRKTPVFLLLLLLIIMKMIMMVMMIFQLELSGAVVYADFAISILSDNNFKPHSGGTFIEMSQMSSLPYYLEKSLFLNSQFWETFPTTPLWSRCLWPATGKCRILPKTDTLLDLQCFYKGN